MKNLLFALLLFPCWLLSQTLPPKPTNQPLRTRIATDANTRDSIRMEARKRADSAYNALIWVVNGGEAKGRAFDDSIRNALSAGLSGKQNIAEAKSFADSVKSAIASAVVSNSVLNGKLNVSEADNRYASKSAVMSRDSLNLLFSSVRSSMDSIRTKVLFTQTAFQSLSANVQAGSKASIVGTGVGSMTILANTMVPGKTYRIHIQGLYSTPLLNLSTVTCRMEVNGTVITTAVAASLIVNASNQAFSADQEITIRSIGTSGSLVAIGSMTFASGSGARGFIDMNTGMSAVPINTTIANTFTPTIQFSNSVAGNSVSSLTLTLEALN